MDRRYAPGPHAAPRTAVVWDVLSQEVNSAGRSLKIIDVGGGTGGFAVPLAKAGHDIVVIDSSPDALAALTRRAAEAGVGDRVAARQGDADSIAELVPAGSADVVLCHSVLEVVDSPDEVARALAATLRSGGAASVIVANRFAAVLARAVGGQFDAAMAVWNDPDATYGPKDTVRRRFDVESATILLGKAGLTVERIHGVRVIADLVSGAVADHDPGSLTEFELATAAHSPFRDVATQLHLLARRP